MSERHADETSERRRDPLRRFWTRDAMRELADSGELGEPPGGDELPEGADAGSDADADAARPRPA